MKFFVALAMAGLISLSVCAADETTEVLQRWVAHPDKSSLVFTATQEGAEFAGRFHQFSVSLELLPAEGGIGLLQITAGIQLASVDTQYQDRDDYLLQKDWFYVEMWPEAIFRSDTISQLDNNRYIAAGTLALRGIEQDVKVELELTLEENGERGRLTGQATINRLDFGVGQGDWASTKWVGDAVNVEFDLAILRAFE